MAVTFKHKFFSLNNDPTCKICGSDINNDLHLDKPKKDDDPSFTCDLCHNDVSKVYPDDNGKNICWTCKDKSIETLIEHIDESARLNTLEREAKDMQGINISSDIFNNKMQFIVNLKTDLQKDNPSLSDGEINKQFQDLLYNRYLHLKQVISELDDQKHSMVLETYAINKSLRDLGNEYRKEVQEKIKEADSKYEPAPIKKVTPKVAKEKKTASERIIEAIAASAGISYTEAKLRYEKMGIKVKEE